MGLSDFKFNRMEMAGSLGDLGTLIPLSVALMAIVGLSPTAVFLMVGLFYVGTGFYYHLPIPVQPLKVVSAIAIASPVAVTLPVMAATGIIFGVLLLILAMTGLIDGLARFFTKPIVRGIQLGLGFILITKGLAFISQPDLLLGKPSAIYLTSGLTFNLVLGVISLFLVLLLLTNERLPAALVIVFLGIVIGVGAGALIGTDFQLGPSEIYLYTPTPSDFWVAVFLLVIPQIPLTLGNAVMATADTAKDLFGDESERATYRAHASSMGFANIFTGFIAGMPMCHGAGGLAAHYRFGARTGGSNIMIGAAFVILAVAFGKVSVALLGAIPAAVLGILLLFAGLELAMLTRDIKEKNDFFITFLIAGIGLATTNMGIAFVAGMAVQYVLKVARINL